MALEFWDRWPVSFKDGPRLVQSGCWLHSPFLGVLFRSLLVQDSLSLFLFLSFSVIRVSLSSAPGCRTFSRRFLQSGLPLSLSPWTREGQVTVRATYPFP